MINDSTNIMYFRVAEFDQSALHGAVHRFLFVYKPVLLVLRCQNFHDLKPLRYSYDRVTSLIFNFLDGNPLLPPISNHGTKTSL